MIQLVGYQFLEQIYSGFKTLVYRGVRELDNRPVIIKLLRHDYPTFNELILFRNQYTIAKNLELPGVIKTYSLEAYQNSYALVMEDFGGISLQEYHSSSLSDFFAIAIQIVTILEGLYHHQIIHKDIKPANILINPITKQIKIIDFSIASLLPKETQTLKYPDVLEGTLAYISPEQTGRMNRGIDWRSDFYSLGVTFFELLTGKLPFISDDPMELVYCHLAQQPPEARSINPDIPPIVSSIITKLMAKNAEDRYQSTLGLKYDLEKAWQSYQEVGICVDFELGKRDISDCFSIPEKLYGREAEIKKLLAAFERVAVGNSEIILVSGFSGIGKTAVVNEIHKPIVRQRGYFIKGKYDQFQSNIPLAGFVQAFRNLIEQLLSESDVKLQEWKSKILDALGEQSQVIIEVIPELEKIIDEQPPVAELSGIAATNRFNLLFPKFLQVFAEKTHPLVIFLDDLQWADSSSLKLIELLMCESFVQNLLLIGAYRDNEVSQAHPLMLTLEEIAKNQIEVNTITLKPLSEKYLNNLVSDTLNCSPDITLPLTQLIYQKTKGNPFFSNQFLKLLHDEKIITLNLDKGYWQCELSQIRELILSDDVVEFMKNQLQKLPVITQQVLKLAACIGNQFDLATLAIVNNKSEMETAAELWKALQEGLVVPTNEVYKLFQDNLEISHPQHLTVNYKFLHDRVQQAAYSLIPEVEKQSTHLNIGQLLLNDIPVEKQEERIFDIINQLNYAVELINNQEQLNELAQLNLRAGKKAKNSNAYTNAFNYLNLAIKMLATDCWQTRYPLTLALYEEVCDVAYLCGEFELMDKFAEQVINSAINLLDKIKVYEIKIQAFIVQNQLTEALTIAFNLLKVIGIIFPETPTQSDIQQAFQATAEKIVGKEIHDLINLPEMTDNNILVAMRILSSMFTAAYLGSPNFVPLITLKMVDLSIEYGNTGLSANGYCTYGFLLCAVVGDIDAGYKFAQLSLNVLSKTNATSLQAKVLLPYNSFVGHWKNRARNFLKPLQEVYKIALETGDLEFAAYALHNYSFNSYLTGKELTELQHQMVGYCDTLKQLKQKTGLVYVNIWRQTVLNLMKESENICSLIGEAYNEEVMLLVHKETNDITALYIVYLNKLTLNYLFGNFLSALKYSIESEKYLSGLTSSLAVPAFYLYDSLVRLAIYFDVTHIEQSQIFEKVNSNQEKMQHWANHAPMNFLHKYYLVEAERYRVLDEKVTAMDYYDKAIALAKENQYIQEEALANELAGKFYLGWGKQTIAQTYLTNAYYCYARWGALAKVEDLEKHYPLLLVSVRQKETFNLNYLETISVKSSLGQTITSTSTKISESLDLLSFIKASQAISSEIQLNKLLKSLIQILIENAGASKAALVMQKSGKLVIEAIGLSVNIVRVLQSKSLEDSQDIPVNLVNYVSRTQEFIIFNDKALENQSTKSAIQNLNDPYIIEQKPKSFLCYPILQQGKLIAILYLENNLISGAFTHDRVQVINLLCSQAAISLENARLYKQAQDYAQQLKNSLDDLKQAQLQLVQSEKMSALGNLVSGIGHEINNPINFLSGNLQPARDYVRDLLKLIDLYQSYYPNPVTEIVKQMKDMDFEYVAVDLPKVISSMEQAVDRIHDISTSLRTFSRADTQKQILFNIHDGINSTIMILKHRLKASETRPEIEVVRNYGDLPQVKCFPGQLNQVFMNLIANAIDALDESNIGRRFHEIQINPNRITITTNIDDDEKRIIIRIEDNGLGMTEEVKAKIFDHLFTTKPVGKGTGLGLAIAYQIIVEKHGGTIEVCSQPDEGASFIISIPI